MELFQCSTAGFQWVIAHLNQRFITPSISKLPFHIPNKPSTCLTLLEHQTLIYCLTENNYFKQRFNLSPHDQGVKLLVQTIDQCLQQKKDIPKTTSL